jgi:isoleucyl-tRNA synthetase
MAMKIIINSFPKSLINIAKCFNDEINDEIDGLKYLQILSPPMRMSIDVVTTKELQTLLKIALKKVEVLNVNTKLGIEDYDPNNIITFRKYCKNSKLRNIYFRLIHKDFFTYSRMKKYKMTE